MRIGARLVTQRQKPRKYWLMLKNDKRQLSPAKTI